MINSYGGYYGGLTSAGPLFNNTGTSGGIFNSKGDVIQFEFPLGGGHVFQANQVGAAGTLNLDGDSIILTSGTTGTTNVFTMAATSSATHIKNSLITATGANNRLYNTAAGNQIFNDGGNTILQGSVTSVLAGGYVADGHGVKGACTGVATAASTLGLYGTGPTVTLTSCTSVVIGGGFVVSGSRVLQTLAVTATAAGVSASSGVVTVLRNGASTTITCTIGTGTSCVDDTHSVSIVDGDLISIQFTTQAAETLAGVKAIVNWN